MTYSKQQSIARRTAGKIPHAITHATRYAESFAIPKSFPPLQLHCQKLLLSESMIRYGSFISIQQKRALLLCSSPPFLCPLLIFNNLLDQQRTGTQPTSMDVDAELTTSFDHSSQQSVGNSVNSTSNQSDSLKTTNSQTTDRQSQQHDSQQQQQDSNHEDEEDNDDENNNNDQNKEYDDLETKRGGLLICPAATRQTSTSTSSTTTTWKTATTFTGSSSPQGHFWDFVKPLLLSTDNSHNNSAESVQQWQSQILQWHLDKQQRHRDAEQKLQQEYLEAQQQQHQDQEEQPKRRGRRKRKKELSAADLAAAAEASVQQQEEDNNSSVLEWYATHIQKIDNNNHDNAMTTNDQGQRQQQQQPQKLKLNKRHSKRSRVEYQEQQQHSSNGVVTVPDIGHEERAQAMQHLWLRHRGQEAAAKLQTMVQFSAGKGTHDHDDCIGLEF